VDYDYRGNVGVVLFNHSDDDFAIKRGDRIAQLILEKISMSDMEEVIDGELPETERGGDGFGSTGVSHALGVPSTTTIATVTASTEDHVMKKARVEDSSNTTNNSNTL
jgi:hypothetical protein